MASPAALGPAIVQSETRRRLAPVNFSENTVQVLDIPRDTVIKRMEVRLDGYFSVTYASGSPIADPTCLAGRICPRLDVVIDGSRYVKSLDFWLLMKQQQYLQGLQGEKAYTDTAAATTPTTRLATIESLYGAAFIYPATTNFAVVNEGYTVFFEQPWAYEFGKESTLLNVKGASSAEIRFNFGAMSNAQRTETSPASVTYVSTLQFVVTLVEAQDIPANSPFFDYKQTVKRVQFSAESRDTLVDLPRGNLISGIWLFVRNGDAQKLPNDIALTDVRLLINGQRIIQATKFLELQSANRSRLGIRAEKNSSTSGGVRHNLAGVAFINLLRGGDVRTALRTDVGAGVDLVQLSVSTAASSGTDSATYTNPVELTIMTDEIASVAQRM